MKNIKSSKILFTGLGVILGLTLVVSVKAFTMETNISNAVAYLKTIVLVDNAGTTTGIILDGNSGKVGIGVQPYDIYSLSVSGDIYSSKTIHADDKVTTRLLELDGLYVGKYINTDGTLNDTGTKPALSFPLASGYLETYYFSGGNMVKNTAQVYLGLNGNVGISNETPQYKLDVNGTGKFNGLKIVGLANTGLGVDSQGNLVARNETDPTVPANLKDGVSWNEVSGKPTTVSSFTNDAGYITSYAETDPTVPANLKDGVSRLEVSGKPTALSSFTNDAAYITTAGETDQTVPASIKDGISRGEVSGKPTIPTNTNELTNGANFITSAGETDPTVPEDLKDGVSWSEVTGKPTTVSSFTNDAGYISSYSETDTFATVTNRGSSTNTAITVNNSITAVSFLYSSDKRLKKDLVKIVNPLDKILALNGYTFKWNKDSKKDVGVVAQEVEKQFPELVENGSNGYKSVKYGNLVAPIIEAIKEFYAKYVAGEAKQQQEIDALRNTIAQLTAKVAALEANVK